MPDDLNDVRLKELKEKGANVHFARRTVAAPPTVTGTNRHAYETWISRWIFNSYHNFPRIRQATRAFKMNDFRNSAKGLPAIIVGIGPSLDSVIEDIKPAAPGAIIIATDAALRPLLARGIQPDVVMNLDASDNQATMWESVLEQTRGMVLLAQTCTSPKTLDAWKGDVIFYNARQDESLFHREVLQTVYSDVGQIPMSATVGNMALLFAQFIGCDVMITAGMDLCYKPVLVTKPVEGGAEEIPATWRYRCNDFKWVADRGVDFGNEPGWMPTENKILYDNDSRLIGTFDHETIITPATGEKRKFKMDTALQFALNSVKGIIGEHGMRVMDTSNGALTPFVRAMTMREAVDEFCGRPIAPFESALRAFVNAARAKVA